MAKNKLYKALQQNKIKPQLKEIRGILGLSIGGSKIVDVPTRKGFVYVRIRDNQSEVVQAQNRTVSPIYDLPVTIVKDGLRWTIKGMDDGKYGNWASPAAYLPKHGYSHSLSRENGTGADPVWIYPDQFMPLLVYPSGTAGGLNVASYVLKTPTNWKYVGNTGTPNLLIHKPNSSGTVVGLVYMNTETGNPGYLIASGSLAYNNPTTIQGLVNYIPYPASNQEPLYAFTMTSGTSGLGWENIFNVRQFYGNLITGTSTSTTTTQPFKFTSINNTGNKTTTSATKTAIDGANLGYLSLTLAINDVVKCELQAQVYHSSTDATGFDFEVSRPTGSTVWTCPNADYGAGVFQGTNRTNVHIVSFYTAAQAGSHGFRPGWLTDGGTITMANDTGNNDSQIFFSITNLGAPA